MARRKSTSSEVTQPPLIEVGDYVGLGARGELVEKIQRLVGAKPDGVFGPFTENAVKVWQLHHGLPVTGRVDHSMSNKLV